MSAKGPLGDLSGMFFDPITNRYYPIPRGGAAQTQNHAGPSRPSSSRVGASTSTTQSDPKLRAPRRRKLENGATETSGGGSKDLSRPRSCQYLPDDLEYGSLGGSTRRPRGLRSKMMPSGSLQSRYNDLYALSFTVLRRMSSLICSFRSQAEMYSNLELTGTMNVLRNPADSLETITHLTVRDRLLLTQS